MAVLKIMKKKTIEEMRQVASERDGFCLSSNYIGAREPLLWRCKYGHEWSASPVNITSKNSWCPYCAGQRGDNFTISKMNQVAQQRGGKCLSTEFHNSKSKPEISGRMLPPQKYLGSSMQGHLEAID